MKWRYWTLKFIWAERSRLWRAYRHFKHYSYFYRQDRHLRKLFGRRPRTALGQACSYVLNNTPSFDDSYFGDMDRDFEVRGRPGWKKAEREA